MGWQDKKLLPVLTLVIAGTSGLLSNSSFNIDIIIIDIYS